MDSVGPKNVMAAPDAWIVRISAPTLKKTRPGGFRLVCPRGVPSVDWTRALVAPTSMVRSVPTRNSDAKSIA